MKTVTRESGFTMVELAISLIVIGLIVGGILKGKELIDNSQVNTVVRQVHAIDTATAMFRESLGALPGDLTNPADRISNCTSAVCNMAGNGNGRIYDTVTSDPLQEQYNFFPHLTRAGFFKGPEGGTAVQMTAATPLPFMLRLPFRPPANSGPTYLSIMFMTTNTMMNYGSMWMPTHVLTSGATRVRYMDMLDRKLDDGKPLTGRMRVYVTSSGGCTVSGGAAYGIAENTYCRFMVRMNF